MKNKLYHYCFIYGLTIFFLNTLIIASFSATPEKIPVDEHTTRVILGAKIQYLEDKNKKFTISDLTSQNSTHTFLTSKDESPSFGFSQSVYWIRFSLKSTTDKDVKLLLELDYPLMDSIQLYIPDENNNYTIKETGYTKKFSTRDVKHRNFVFKLLVPGHSGKTYYMRFENEDRMEFPLTIWSPISFQEKDHIEQYLLGIYYGILFVMFLYHFLLAIKIKQKSYFYYSLFIVAYGFVQLTQNGLGYEFFWPDFMTRFNHHIPASAAICLILIITFSQSFLNTKYNNRLIHKFFLIEKALFLPSFFLQFIINYSISIQYTLSLSAVAIGTVLYAGIDSYKKKYRPAKYFLIAWTIFLVAGLIYFLKVFGVIEPNLFTNNSMQLGSAILLILFSFALGDRIKLLEQETEETSRELIKSQIREAEVTNKSKKEIAEAYKIVSFSERKYKFLVESSNDIIFSLDTNFNIISINNAVRIHLKLNQDDLIGTSILKLVYIGHYTGESFGGMVARQSFQDKLDLVMEEKKPIEFTTEFNSSVLQEPKLLHLRLEYIKEEDRDEILGKASPVLEDSLLRYFQTERVHYSISNNLFLAEEVTHRLTLNLSKYMQSKDINFLRIALREIIVNSIEHGNLNISFDEKTQAIMQDRYFDYLSELQRKPENMYKRVRIEYHITDERVAYKITDEGEGFDHAKIMAVDPDEVNKSMLTHGRGVRMANEAFNEIRYNKKGNQVLLIKYFD